MSDKINLGVPTQWGDEKRGWHMDRTISVGNVITSLLIIFGMYTWAGDVDKRILTNTLENKNLREQLMAQHVATAALREELRSDLDKINAKLDRLIERRAIE